MIFYVRKIFRKQTGNFTFVVVTDREDLDGQSRIRVRSTVEAVFDAHLPGSYDRAIFTEKCNTVFDLMLDYASQGLKWAT